MPPMLWLAILGGLLALMIVAVFALYLSRRRIPQARMTEKDQALVKDALYEDGESPSSLVSEQIEEMAKRKLTQYPDLTDIRLDFGTMPDGTIDIWVDDEQYDDIEDIPDDRIRKAIKEAVEEFNRQANN